MINTISKIIPQREFDSLLDYTFSDPTYKVAGKRFKRKYGKTWYEIEYTASGNPDRLGITYTPLIVCLDE